MRDLQGAARWSSGAVDSPAAALEQDSHRACAHGSSIVHDIVRDLAVVSP